MGVPELGELLQAFDDPTASVLEIAAGVVIEAAEMRALDTARDVFHGRLAFIRDLVNL
jgi:hypothetical protein